MYIHIDLVGAVIFVEQISILNGTEDGRHLQNKKYD